MTKVRKHSPFDLNIPKMGYFILYRHDKGLIGDLIKKTQLKMGFSEEDAQYTHVEVSGGGNNSVYVGTPLSSVIDIKKKYKGRYVKIVSYNDYIDYEGQVGYHKRYKVAFWSASKCNLKYDFFGVIGFVLRIVKHFNDRYFCSENCLWSLQKEYPGALGIDPEDCTPAHFADKDKFFTIWEGVIN